jgi:hypothetical protein
MKHLKQAGVKKLKQARAFRLFAVAVIIFNATNVQIWLKNALATSPKC